MERLIVGITGATGIQYGLRVLQLLKECPVETHLVVSRSAELVMAYETDFSKEALSALATVVHPVGDMGVSIASGSFKTCGMLIAPCSMKTLSEIASGGGDFFFAYPGCRCGVEGAPTAGTDGQGNAFTSGAFA